MGKSQFSSLRPNFYLCSVIVQIINLNPMKKFLLPVVAALLFLIATPDQAKAQCPPNADNIPCFNLPSGPCVTFPNGKLRVWLAAQLVYKAKPYMDNEFNYSFGQYLNKYYQNEMKAEYLGGNWATGQSFRMTMGDCNVIVVTEGGF